MTKRISIIPLIIPFNFHTFTAGVGLLSLRTHESYALTNPKKKASLVRMDWHLGASLLNVRKLGSSFYSAMWILTDHMAPTHERIDHCEALKRSLQRSLD